MKKRRKILFLLVFLTGLLLSMTTYAWFTTNRIFEIESFDIQVASKGGIEISTDAIDWKGVVGMLEFIAAANTYPSNINQIPNQVRPVSSAGEVEDAKLKIFYGEVAMDKYHYLSAERTVEKARLMEDSEAYFVAFDVFIKSPMPKQLMIAPGSGVSYEADLSNPSGIENAFRIAFINQGNAPETNSLHSIQNLNSGTSAIIWEPNYNSHTNSAVEHAKNVYAINTTTNAPRLTYYGIKTEIPSNLRLDVSKANANDNPNYFALVNPQITTVSNNDQFQDFINITSGITKIRIYIWLEGQDVDCEDGANYGNLAINLQFVAR